MVQLEGLGKLKKKINASSGLEPATFHLVEGRRYSSADVLHCQRMRVSLCYEFISSAERNEREKQANCTWEK
jgi:hypothetical protein